MGKKFPYVHLLADAREGSESEDVQIGSVDSGNRGLDNTTERDNRIACKVSDGQDGHVSNEALCPALFRLPNDARFPMHQHNMSIQGNWTRLERLTYCEEEAGVGTVLYHLPAQRKQSLLMVQSLDGLWRQAVFKPDSNGCGSCHTCVSPNDEPPTCSTSGCAGCPVVGSLHLPAWLLPPNVLAGAVFEVLLLCALAEAVGGGFTQVAVTLQVEGRRDACGVCGGDNSSCADCFGVPYGTAVRDGCGTCGGEDRSCNGNATYYLSFLSGYQAPAGGSPPLGERMENQWLQVPHVCAGDAITVGWRVANAAEADDRLVIFFPWRFGRLPAASDQLIFPTGSSPSENKFSGSLSFQTSPEWWVEDDAADGNLEIHFEYMTHGPTVDHGVYAQEQAAAVSPTLALAPPADVCGVCGGDGLSCAGCDGVANSDLVMDECGVCGGQNECLDCRGVPHGMSRLDLCGKCALPALVCLSGPSAGDSCSAEADCGSSSPVHGSGTEADADGNHAFNARRCGPSSLRVGEWNKCVDCAGVVNGSATKDSCGVCGGVDDSCARPFAVEAAVTETCLHLPVTAIWTGPSNRDQSTYIGIARLTADGSYGPISTWAPVLPARIVSGSNRPINGQEVIGESAYHPPGDVGSGYVVFNREHLWQQPDSCAEGDRGGWAAGSRDAASCLDGAQYLRPAIEGTYRFELVDAATSSHISANSQPFTILPAADCGCDGVPHSGRAPDICGVCGGDRSSCTGILPIQARLHGSRCSASVFSHTCILLLIPYTVSSEDGPACWLLDASAGLHAIQDISFE